MKNQKKKMIKTSKNEIGITLIALVITIIVLLILAGVTISAISGENGLIFNAQKASFYTEMQAIEEQKELEKLQSTISNSNNKFIERAITIEEIKNLKDTLKAEIIFARNGFGKGEMITTKQIWKNNYYNCKDIFSDENELEFLVKDIYYISKESSGKSKEYIYDSTSDMCFKIKQTKIGKEIVHSLRYAKFIIDGENSTGIGIIDMEVGTQTATDGTKSYEPDLNNFSYKTEVIYYSPDYKKEYKITVKEFIEKNKPSTMEKEGEIYTFANYSKTDNLVYANIRCSANELESYWVWIPRYAYKLDQTNESSEIIFVDINDKEFNGKELEEGYKVHEAFNQGDKKLKGIWFSKYHPTAIETVQIDKSEPEVPNLDNFEEKETKLIYYTLDGKNNIEVEYVKTDEIQQRIEKDGIDYYFYNYQEKLWANIKCTSNGLESWWVWIPRYAYKLESGESAVILVNENDKPIDTKTYGTTLPKGYKVHEGFKQEGNNLKGMWFSKYQPSPTEVGKVDSIEPETPNLNNFKENETKLIYYTLDGKSNIEVDYVKTNEIQQKIEKDGIDYYFYNYQEKLWANIKCTSNGLESWWVWIPRYAYKLESGETKVILIDENNKPLDKQKYGENLPKGYKVHEAFNQEGNKLKGIWFSKYYPSKESG